MAVSAAAPRERLAAPALADPFPWAAAAAYAAIYFALGYIRYAAHRNFVDLGIFAQTAASAFGCFCNTVEGSHWAVHFSPVLYIAGALMRVWPSALSLVALQAVAGALTIPPIYAIVRGHADRRSARLAAAVVFLYPPLAGVVFNDFHENGLAPAAIAWLLWAFDAGRIGWTVAFTFLALSVKEDQALFVAAGGLVGAAAYRADRARMPLAIFAAAASAAVFIGYFALGHPHSAGRFYAWSPGDFRALLPGGIVERIGFLLLAFVPLLFVPLRTPAALVVALPLAEVLVSRMSTTYTIGSHYAGAWAGWAFYAFALGVGLLWSRDPHRAHRVLYWCIGLCIAEFAAADPLHPGFFLHARGARDVALDNFLRTLPRGISLATQEEAYTHLAASDPNVTVLPETPSQPITACSILLDADFSGSPRLQEAGPLVAQLARSGVYRVAVRNGGITLYMKTAGCR
ncbi:MAG TPA: DUF2079 domain-containing protein [Candidatus Baltobacteraceae bacterium]|nr:DUF2079 domain-containing protein [Candidatus Baltobacteraceae bacterium]